MSLKQTVISCRSGALALAAYGAALPVRRELSCLELLVLFLQGKRTMLDLNVNRDLSGTGISDLTTPLKNQLLPVP